MIWVNTKRVFRSGFVNFWRNGVVSAASVLVMTVTLLVIGSLILSSAFMDASLAKIKSQVDISVSFKIDATDSDVLAMKNTLSALPEVKAVDYISRDKELADFKERHKDNNLLIQSLEEVGNPFGARINISAKDPSQYESIVHFLDSADVAGGVNKNIIDQITFKKDIVDRLNNMINSLQKVSFVISLVMILMSILVTFNTISLAIYSYREEIGVMKLVGAGDNYVRGPFMVEGIIAGVASAFISIVALYPLAIWVKNVTGGIYGGIDMVAYYSNNFAQIFLILLGSGVALGIVSSFLAIRKYLKI